MSQVQEKKIHKGFDITSEIDDHISKRFEIKKRLGKGAYGIVWKAVDRKTKETVAIKKIFDAFRNQTDAQRTFREIVFLQSFRNHPNIIKLHSIHRASNNRDIYLGFEYMQTDLHNVIKRGDILKDIHKKYIMYQILKATKYIHSGNVIHRDQKPSNVLIDNSCRVKIADFGLARSVSSCGDGQSDVDPCLTDYVATRWYRAPEILIASRHYTKGIDMWSLGCILGEMIIGKPLFPGTSTMNQVEMIMASINPPSERDILAVCNTYGSCLIRNSVSHRTPIRDTLRSGPPQGIDLACSLLIFNPIMRLTAEQALQHTYVAEFHQEKNEPIIGRQIIPPLCDDQRLSVDEYRNRLYALMKKNSTRNISLDINSTQPESEELPSTKTPNKNISKQILPTYNPSVPPKIKSSDKSRCTLSNTVFQYAQKLHQPPSTSEGIPDINKNISISKNTMERKKSTSKITQENNIHSRNCKRNPLIKYFSTEEYYSSKNQKLDDDLKLKYKSIARSLSEDTYMSKINGKKKPMNYGSINGISKLPGDRFQKPLINKDHKNSSTSFDSKPRML